MLMMLMLLKFLLMLLLMLFLMLLLMLMLMMFLMVSAGVHVIVGGTEGSNSPFFHPSFLLCPTSPRSLPQGSRGAFDGIGGGVVWGFFGVVWRFLGVVFHHSPFQLHHPFIFTLLYLSSIHPFIHPSIHSLFHHSTLHSSSG